MFTIERFIEAMQGHRQQTPKYSRHMQILLEIGETEFTKGDYDNGNAFKNEIRNILNEPHNDKGEYEFATWDELSIEEKQDKIKNCLSEFFNELIAHESEHQYQHNTVKVFDLWNAIDDDFEDYDVYSDFYMLYKSIGKKYPEFFGKEHQSNPYINRQKKADSNKKQDKIKSDLSNTQIGVLIRLLQNTKTFPSWTARETTNILVETSAFSQDLRQYITSAIGLSPIEKKEIIEKLKMVIKEISEL